MPATVANPNDPFSSLSDYTTPTTGGEAGTLVSTPAEVNLANSASLDSLSKRINEINQRAQQAANAGRIPGGAGLEAQSSENIAQELAGNLPTSFINNLQSGLAQQWGGRGFGADTGAMNSAALRSMGIEAMQRQAQGQSDLSAATARNPSAPIYDISRSMLSPELYASYLNQKAQQSQAAAELSQRSREAERAMQEQIREFDITGDRQAAERAAQYGNQAAQLAEQARQFNAAQSQQAGQFNVTQQGLNQRQAAELAQQNAQYYANLQQQMDLANQQYGLQLYGLGKQEELSFQDRVNQLRASNPAAFGLAPTPYTPAQERVGFGR